MDTEQTIREQEFEIYLNKEKRILFLEKLIEERDVYIHQLKQLLESQNKQYTELKKQLENSRNELKILHEEKEVDKQPNTD